MIPSCEMLRTHDPIQKSAARRLPELEEGNGKQPLSEYRVLFGSDENILELDKGSGCTTL